MQSHQLINQTSGKQEYYTPMPIVDAARVVMGRIGLDPASSEAANARIKADAWFGIGDNSLERAWCDEVWLNHPFGRKKNPLWISKLIAEGTTGNIKCACCITFAATSETWFQPLMNHIQCYLHPRTNFYLPDGSLKRGVSKGSVVTGIGVSWAKFDTEFRRLGAIKVPYGG